MAMKPPKRKYYETVEYACPGCGAKASQTWTKPMNEMRMQQIRGTFCPNCEKERRKYEK